MSKINQESDSKSPLALSSNENENLIQGASFVTGASDSPMGSPNAEFAGKNELS